MQRNGYRGAKPSLDLSPVPLIKRQSSQSCGKTNNNSNVSRFSFLSVHNRREIMDINKARELYLFTLSLLPNYLMDLFLENDRSIQSILLSSQSENEANYLDSTQFWEMNTLLESKLHELDYVRARECIQQIVEELKGYVYLHDQMIAFCQSNQLLQINVVGNLTPIIGLIIEAEKKCFGEEVKIPRSDSHVSFNSQIWDNNSSDEQENMSYMKSDLKRYLALIVQIKHIASELNYTANPSLDPYRVFAKELEFIFHLKGVYEQLLQFADCVSLSNVNIQEENEDKILKAFKSDFIELNLSADTSKKIITEGNCHQMFLRNINDDYYSRFQAAAKFLQKQIKEMDKSRFARFVYSRSKRKGFDCEKLRNLPVAGIILFIRFVKDYENPYELMLDLQDSQKSIFEEYSRLAQPSPFNNTVRL